jgi:PAS domain S-box-containing protein
MQGDTAQHGAPPEGRLTLLGYGVAVVSVAAGLLLARWLQPALDPELPLLVAVLIAAWFGGFRPALLASLLGTLAVAYYFSSPNNSFAVDLAHVPRIGMFALLAATFATISAARRRAEHSLKMARDEMEVRVQQRTAELQQTNDWLQAEIAERRRAEEALRERASLLDLTHDSVFVRDHDNVITLWNRGAEEQYGWTLEEALGRKSHELLRTVFTAPVDEITGELTRTGRWEGELLHTRRDGTQIVVASRWALQSDAQGHPLAVLETNNDITAGKQAEQALRQQANLLEQAHDAIFVWEFPRTIVYWNRGAEQLYGFSRTEAIGRLGHELLHTEHPMPAPDFEATLERDGEWTGELTHTTRDGRKIIVESRHVLMPGADGRRLVLETNRDVTERKRAEHALEELAGRLIHAQEEERRRIGRELHDHISQTLGVLTIKIDQLRANGEIPPGLEEALAELRRDTSEITDDVHRLSHRLHSSTLDYLGLVPALQKLVSEFSERHGISITFAHASLPQSLPSDDALCLFRVAEESLTNIVKHSQSRSASIHVAGAPDGIHLTVQDAGEGFDVTGAASKAGLGFVSMQERLRALRGTIHVDSAPSRGTRIDAWVPSIALAPAHDKAAHRSETA